MREKFSIGNVSSDNYGMVLTEILTWETPEINVKFEPIPGRHDTLTTWDGRLKNLEFSYFAYINKDFFAQYSRFRKLKIRLVVRITELKPLKKVCRPK